MQLSATERQSYVLDPAAGSSYFLSSDDVETCVDMSADSGIDPGLSMDVDSVSCAVALLEYARSSRPVLLEDVRYWLSLHDQEQSCALSEDSRASAESEFCESSEKCRASRCSSTPTEDPAARVWGLSSPVGPREDPRWSLLTEEWREVYRWRAEVVRLDHSYDGNSYRGNASSGRRGNCQCSTPDGRPGGSCRGNVATCRYNEVSGGNDTASQVLFSSASSFSGVKRLSPAFERAYEGDVVYDSVAADTPEAVPCVSPVLRHDELFAMKSRLEDTVYGGATSATQPPPVRRRRGRKRGIGLSRTDLLPRADTSFSSLFESVRGGTRARKCRRVSGRVGGRGSRGGGGGLGRGGMLRYDEEGGLVNGFYARGEQHLCTRCRKAFSKRHYLLRHFRRMHPEGETRTGGRFGRSGSRRRRGRGGHSRGNVATHVTTHGDVTTSFPPDADNQDEEDSDFSDDDDMELGIPKPLRGQVTRGNHGIEGHRERFATGEYWRDSYESSNTSREIEQGKYGSKPTQNHVRFDASYGMTNYSEHVEPAGSNSNSPLSPTASSYRRTSLMHDSSLAARYVSNTCVRNSSSVRPYNADSSDAEAGLLAGPDVSPRWSRTSVHSRARAPSGATQDLSGHQHAGSSKGHHYRYAEDAAAIERRGDTQHDSIGSVRAELRDLECKERFESMACSPTHGKDATSRHYRTHQERLHAEAVINDDESDCKPFTYNSPAAYDPPVDEVAECARGLSRYRHVPGSAGNGATMSAGAYRALGTSQTLGTAARNLTFVEESGVNRDGLSDGGCVATLGNPAVSSSSSSTAIDVHNYCTTRHEPLRVRTWRYSSRPGARMHEERGAEQEDERDDSSPNSTTDDWVAGEVTNTDSAGIPGSLLYAGRHSSADVERLNNGRRRRSCSGSSSGSQ